VRRAVVSWLNGWMALHFIGNSSQSYGALPAMWDHTVLPTTDTSARVHVLRYNPSQTGRLSIYLLWRDEKLSWAWRGVLRVRRQSPFSSINHIIAMRQGVEPTTSRLEVQRLNRCISKPPSRENLWKRIQDHLLRIGGQSAPDDGATKICTWMYVFSCIIRQS